MPDLDLSSVAGLVLAGGESRRFGSDKALALLHGEPLLAHVLAGLRRLGLGELLVAAKRAEPYAELAARFGARVVLDGNAQLTPLAGLAAGLSAASRPLVFCCAADMPFAADGALVLALVAARGGGAAVVPMSEGERQPLCALYAQDTCAGEARQLLRAAGDTPRGPSALLGAVGAVQIDWPDRRPFLDADDANSLELLAVWPAP